MADYSNSIIPSSPLLGIDIRDTLVAGGAVFTLPAGSVNPNYAPNYFTAGANINKWAKYKPVPYPSVSIDGITDWWKGYRASSDVGYINLCGIRIPTVNSLAQTNNVWEPDLPRGGESEPYRLGDFRSYQHNSNPSFKIMLSDALQLAVGKNFGCYAYFPDEPETYDSTKALQMADLTAIGGYYMVLYLYNYTKNLVVGTKITTDPISAGTDWGLWFSFEEMDPYIDDGDDVGAYVWFTSLPDNAFSNRISAKITSDSVVSGRFTAHISLTIYRINYQYSDITLGQPNVYIANNAYYIGKNIVDDDDVTYTNIGRTLYIQNWNFLGHTNVPAGYNVTWKLIAETAYPYNEEGDFTNPAIPRTVFYSSTHASTETLNISSDGLEYTFYNTANGTMQANAIPVFSETSQVRLTVQCTLSGTVAFEKKVITSEIILNLSDL